MGTNVHDLHPWLGWDAANPGNSGHYHQSVVWHARLQCQTALAEWQVEHPAMQKPVPGETEAVGILQSKQAMTPFVSMGVACRYEKRHANVSAHVSPCFRVKEGDTVVIGQCRCAAWN